MKKTKPKDPTAAKRTAELKKRLVESGGKRMCINLDGPHVSKLNHLVAAGYAADNSDAIRKLIDEKDALDTVSAHG